MRLVSWSRSFLAPYFRSRCSVRRAVWAFRAAARRWPSGRLVVRWRVVEWLVPAGLVPPGSDCAGLSLYLWPAPPPRCPPADWDGPMDWNT